MRKVTIAPVLLATMLFIQAPVSAQGFLKKLKDKASSVTDKLLEKKVENAVGIDNSQSNSSTGSSSGSSGKPSNKGGAGLTNSTPPDVVQQINDADKAHQAGSLSEARYSIQQALLGVELQIGRAILKSFPTTVSGLERDTLDDKVASAQWGWSNLTIQRVYKKGDKQLTITVGNNSIYSGMMGVVFNTAYTQSNGETQNYKQIKVKGNNAVIKYDKDEGYAVLVQLGQSGLITWEGINFATEQEMLTAVNTFDIDGIKKMLGEK
ncbi:hypothetical protein EXU57_02820 [Segetibacter sp. 3557_3]|uniref:hypothetical protein n=1 Tax=Segetibacter sp. 3557_3 TaxID=2547429 RepID=UPI001058DF1B|nr:hypothetical protein [Segetibacter sp. 3557_3]TDH29024.1 hypothetical protein EXU57_02820 [Segetibacter sp. 3557_3]